jgi:hypothetical protein
MYTTVDFAFHTILEMAPQPVLSFHLRKIEEEFLWFRSRECRRGSAPSFRVLDEMELGQRTGQYIEAILDLANTTDTALIPMIGLGDEYVALESHPLYFVNFTDTVDENIEGLFKEEDDEGEPTKASSARRDVVLQRTSPVAPIYDTLFEGIRIREIYADAYSATTSVGAGRPGWDSLFIYIRPQSRTRLKVRWWIDECKGGALVTNLL